MAGELEEGQEVETVIEESSIPRPFDVCPSAINVYRQRYQPFMFILPSCFIRILHFSQRYVLLNDTE
jgi:hypothetical protein